jgi:PAS domain S-box-containing protein
MVAAQAEENRWTRDKLLAIVECAPIAIITVSPGGLVETWNAEAERIFNKSEDQAVGRTWASLAGRQRSTLSAIEERVKNGERISNLPFSIRRSEEQILDLEISASPLARDGDELSGIVAIVSDVTQRNRAERLLKELNSELERRVTERTAELAASNEELEAFCFSVSHDLRAPLRAIDGFSRAVVQECEDILPTTSKNHLIRVRKASRRLSELIDSLLSLTRLTRVEIQREWTNLSEIAAETVADLEVSSPENNSNFQIEPNIHAYGDPRLLRILLDNLLGNALKFSAEKDGTSIRFGRVGNEFFVSDEGAGFDMAYVHRLFQPFERLHSSQDYPGNGIGLATAHRIVTRHGGRIWGESTVGEGAVFRFTLSDGPNR